MLGGSERRTYQRSEDFHCEVKVSRDKERWRDTVVCDLSSEGLKFQTDEEFAVGDTVWFDMNVIGFLTNFEFITEGIIRHKDKNTFGASFEGLKHDLKIHIDEATRSFGPRNILY